MNLFYLDEDLDRCAEAHVDKHVCKIQLEAAQLICTALWVDKLLGYEPRPLNSEELAEIKAHMLELAPNMEDRQHLDIPYKVAHPNHPSCVWVRSSLENFEWAHCYVNALESESRWRGNNPHKSCAVVNRLPEPKMLESAGFSTPTLAMPDQYKSDDAVLSYREYYINEKASLASWKRRGKPHWWRE